MPSVFETWVDGRKLALSNLNKVMWPEVGFTKRQMIAYYTEIAPVLLPHLRDRPITLKRYPDGVDGSYWYQNRCRGRPEWLRTHPVPSYSKPGESFRQCVVDDLPSLVWILNLASIELHPLLWRAGSEHHATHVVFDLDPGPPAGLSECCRVALALQSALEELNLASTAKTSGYKGMHVCVPVAPGHDFAKTKPFARTIASRVAAERPDIALTSAAKRMRSGRVAIDWRQNDRMRSTVAPYSLRAASRPWISTPLHWSEVVTAAAGRDEDPLRFGPKEVLERVRDRGDLFCDVLAWEQQLPDL